MTIAIYPYKNGSKSAKALAEGLGIKVLKREGVRRKREVLINWGSSAIERDIRFNQILNEPEAIHNASNKLSSFRLFDAEGVPTVPWTTDFDEAFDWLKTSNVVARKTLTGHSGQGIVIIENQEQMIEAPLYTKYVKKEQEYRIHVFQGNIIFQQRKARKKEVPDAQVNWQIRNLNGGFIFANDGVDAPEAVKLAAIAAVESLGLDFGASDVGFKDGAAVVYEVNTACGLQGKNLEAYVNKFKEFQ